MNKLKQQCGETLVETLTSILVLAFVFLFLAAAIATGVRINAEVSRTDVSFHYATTPDDTLTLKVKRDGVAAETYTVLEYSSSPDADGDAQYHYYTYQP